MSITSIAVAPLSDGRLQLFAAHNGQLWSCWKTATDPNAGWTDWSPFQPNDDADFVDFELGVAAPLRDGPIQLLALGGTPNQVGVIGGPALATTFKVGDDPNAGWAAWEPLYAGSFGPPGSPATGVAAVVVGPLSDSRLQAVFLEEPVGGSGPAPTRLLTTWRRTADDASTWASVRPFAPAPPEPMVPLAMGALSFANLQLWGVCPEGLFTTWKSAPTANAPWVGWTQFQPLPSGRAPRAMATGLLWDGRAQLFAADDAGAVFSCWKTDVAPGSPWSDWSPFFGEDIVGLAVGRLSDARLQVWGLNRNGELLTTWKQTIDPNSGWASWTPFPAP